MEPYRTVSSLIPPFAAWMRASPAWELEDSLLSADTYRDQARALLSLSSLPARPTEVLFPVDLARREIRMLAI